MIFNTDNIPPILELALQSIKSYKQNSNSNVFQHNWELYSAKVAEMIPDAHISNDGENVYIGKLSPGCLACKAGTWDCIFLTMQCNLKCSFCCSPVQSRPINTFYSPFGTSMETLKENYHFSSINAVSFTGGEPFCCPEKLFSTFETLKNHFPDKYYWLYTNGLLVTEDHLLRLGDLSLDEIRFNLAATGYDNTDVLRTVSLASRYIKRITVEIPSIPAHTDQVIASLYNWSSAGISQLNLHQLMREKGSFSETLSGQFNTLVLEDGHRTDFSDQSRESTLTIMKHVWEKRLNLTVNDCSIQNKLRQIRGRRHSQSSLYKEQFEKIVDFDSLQRILAFKSRDEFLFIDENMETIDHFKKMNYQIVKMIRKTPLFRNNCDQWTIIEHI